jgi:hypothetical protein
MLVAFTSGRRRRGETTERGYQPRGGYSTPSTCAHTATVARNRLNDAKARASSQTDRIIGYAPFGMKREHSSLFVLSQVCSLGPCNTIAKIHSYLGEHE